jgi:hypothetical protein
MVMKSRKELAFKGKLLTFDPGETTGWCDVDTTTTPYLVTWGQFKTWPLVDAFKNLDLYINNLKPDYVVYESYNIYSWKSDDHKQSDVPTLQVIGMLQTLLISRSIPYSTRNAQQAKGFVTDDKLKSWGLYTRGDRHGRDALRHACFHLLFGPPKAAGE